MRRRAFKQGRIISRWSAPKRFYSIGPLIAQEGATKSEVDPDNSTQPVQNGAIENTPEGLHTSPKHENGVNDTQKPSSRRSLPLSPLMDPAYLAAKQKHRFPKAAPSKEPTPFQQQLAKNPYGMMSRLS
jgi:hypothetical protein